MHTHTMHTATHICIPTLRHARTHTLKTQPYILPHLPPVLHTVGFQGGWGFHHRRWGDESPAAGQGLQNWFPRAWERKVDSKRGAARLQGDSQDARGVWSKARRETGRCEAGQMNQDGQTDTWAKQDPGHRHSQTGVPQHSLSLVIPAAASRARPLR
jgi:hypothetical protein